MATAGPSALLGGCLALVPRLDPKSTGQTIDLRSSVGLILELFLDPDRTSGRGGGGLKTGPAQDR